MKSLTSTAKLTGTILIKSKSIFAINGLGYRNVSVKSGESFNIDESFEDVIVYKDDEPVYQVQAGRPLSVSNRLEDGFFTTTLRTF